MSINRGTLSTGAVADLFVLTVVLLLPCSANARTRESGPLFFSEGIPLLENMELKEVASDQVYEFLFLNLTLPIKGATGSPVRPIAVR